MAVSFTMLAIRDAMETVMKIVDPDWEEHPHLRGTPMRVAQMYEEMLLANHGFEFTTFENKDVDQMIVIRDLYFYSLCAHHMLPFHGQAHIAYIPRTKLAGLSKFARAVAHFSLGLNIQEELTKDIHDFLVEHLEPKGLGVVLEAEHLCMSMRGIEKPGHLTTTSAMYGVFLDPEKGARQEFLALVGRPHG